MSKLAYVVLSANKASVFEDLIIEVSHRAFERLENIRDEKSENQHVVGIFNDRESAEALAVSLLKGSVGKELGINIPETTLEPTKDWPLAVWTVIHSSWDGEVILVIWRDKYGQLLGSTQNKEVGVGFWRDGVPNDADILKAQIDTNDIIDWVCSVLPPITADGDFKLKSLLYFIHSSDELEKVSFEIDGQNDTKNINAAIQKLINRGESVLGCARNNACWTQDLAFIALTQAVHRNLQLLARNQGK